MLESARADRAKPYLTIHQAEAGPPAIQYGVDGARVTADPVEDRPDDAVGIDGVGVPGEIEGEVIARTCVGARERLDRSVIEERARSVRGRGEDEPLETHQALQ